MRPLLEGERKNMVSINKYMVVSSGQLLKIWKLVYDWTERWVEEATLGNGDLHIGGCKTSLGYSNNLFSTCLKEKKKKHPQFLKM